ncbi:hypothetical protein [Streptomyces sp. NPDC017940]|uniref:hypothetical protein n=1 Tax=Streptomyces sp. NPDC017940 TaxID=3365017 RepID=UPI00378D602E
MFQGRAGRRMLVITAGAAGLLGAAGSPVWAGGIGVIGSPAFDNTCVIDSVGSFAVGATVSDGGLLGGNASQAPMDLSRNQCGGADLVPAENGLFPWLYVAPE